MLIPQPLIEGMWLDLRGGTDIFGPQFQPDSFSSQEGATRYLLGELESFRRTLTVDVVCQVLRAVDQAFEGGLLAYMMRREVPTYMAPTETLEAMCSTPGRLVQVNSEWFLRSMPESYGELKATP